MLTDQQLINPLMAFTDGDRCVIDVLSGCPLAIVGGVAEGPVAGAIAEIERLMQMPALRPPHIRVIGEGELIDAEQFTEERVIARSPGHQLLIPGRLEVLLAQGNTVVMDSLQDFVPRFLPGCDALSHLYGVPTEVAAFVSPPNSQALPPHADAYEIFVVQLLGHKRWRLFPKPAAMGDGRVVALEDVGDPLLDTTLAAGDVLYLPYGTTHEVTSGDDVSVHLSFTARPLSWNALLSRALSRCLPQAAGRHAFLGRDWLESNVATLRDYSRIFGEVVSASPEMFLSDADTENHLSPQSFAGPSLTELDAICRRTSPVTLRLGDGCYMRVEEGGHVIVGTPHGVEVTCGEWIKPYMESLGRADGAGVELSISGDSGEALAGVVKRLIILGALTPV